MLLLPLLVPASARSDGTVTGHGRFERIKGKPHMGYVELYESNLFLSPAASPPVGPSRRLGAPPNQAPTYDGFYSITMPAGTYSILVNQPLFFIRPKVLPDVVIRDGQTTVAHVELPIDFSTAFRDPGQWTGPENTWYQTYTAAGMSVTGVSFVLAGTAATVCSVSVMEDNGDADVRNWTVLATRSVSVGTNTDNWVRWRSGEVPTVPGRRYAVRLAGTNGSIQPYKRNKDANSYVGGQAYNSAGTPQNFDLNCTVFADNDGTRVTMNKRTQGEGSLVDGNWGQRWGQSFIARGRYLAGADVWAAGDVQGGACPNAWDLTFEWKVRRGGPTGAQVGPTKQTRAAYQAFGVGLHGVSYNRGEVPLQSGDTYFIEFRYASGPPCHPEGFNPLISNDPFAEGMAYQGDSARPNMDLAMTILEYTQPMDSPFITVAPSAFVRTIRQGRIPPDDTFAVRNTGAGTLNYTITDNSPWLYCDPAAGTSTGEADEIVIHYETGGLSVGMYTATITIADPAAYNHPQSLQVQLEVQAVRQDFDRDGDVDVSDFSFFQACFNGPGRPPVFTQCAVADVDQDGDVDVSDFGTFQVCYNGPGQAPTASCPD